MENVTPFLTVLVAVVLAFITAAITSFSGHYIARFNADAEDFREFRRKTKDENLETYLSIYQRIRSVERAILHFRNVNEVKANDFDPFLILMFRILSEATDQYARTVDWSYNEKIYFVPEKLENKCEKLASRLHRAIDETKIETTNMLTLSIVPKDRERREKGKYIDVVLSELKKKKLAFIRLQHRDGIRETKIEKRRQISNSPLFDRGFCDSLLGEIKDIRHDLKKIVAY